MYAISEYSHTVSMMASSSFSHTNVVKREGGNHIPYWIQAPWNDVTFTYPHHGNGVGRLVFQNSEERCKLQFLFTCQHHKIFELERKNNVVVDLIKPGQISIKSNTYDFNPDVFRYVIQTYIKDIVIFNIVLSSEDAKDVQIPKTPPSLVSNKYVILVQDDQVLVCLADYAENMNDFLKVVGYTYIDRVNISLIQENLKDLKIEKEVYLEINLKSIEVDTKTQMCKFVWHGGRRQNGNDLIQKFTAKCKTTVIDFNTRGISWTKHAFPLIFPNQDVKNSSFVKYIKTKCSERWPNVPPFSLIGDTDKHICLIQRYSGEQGLEALIRNSLCFHKTMRIIFETEAFKQLLVINTQSLWFDKEHEFVVCTDDLNDAVSFLIVSLESSNTALVRSELLPIYLTSFGGELIQKCKTEYNVDVKVYATSVLLEAQNRPQLDKCSHFLNDVTQEGGHLAIVIGQRYIESCMKELSNALLIKSLCWALYPKDKHEDKIMYATEWQDPSGSSIFRVKDIGSEMPADTDLLIELTDDRLIPLDVKFRDHARQPAAATSRVSMSTHPDMQINMGGIVKQSSDALPKGGHRIKDIRSIVCKMGDGIKTIVINNDELQKSFSSLFAMAQHMNYTRMCICPSLDDIAGDKLNECDIVKHLVLASSSQNRSPFKRMTVDIFVQQREMETVTKQLESVLMENCKAYVKDPHYFMPKGIEIPIIVESGCLENEKVDVIVCPITTYLGFVGQCAEKIKAMAGEDMVKECRSKYSTTIPELFVGYTKAYKMSSNHVKYIFQTNLPRYKNDGEQTIRHIVKKCLYMAEEQSSKSIAFPALGVGRLEYPWRETAFQMFEAVFEYGKQNPNTKIQKIKFVIFEKDECLRQVFENEEYRRSKKCTSNSRRSFQIDNLDLHIHQKSIGRSGNIVLRVMKRSNATFPAYAVEFIFDKGEDKWKRKSALEEPVTWNDQIIIQSGIQTIPTEIARQLRDEKATHLIWNLDTNSQTVHGNQVRQVVTMMESMCRDVTFTCLRIIDVIVPDTSALESFRLQTDLSDWTRVCPDESEYVLELMAKSKDDLELTRRSIIKVLCEKPDLSNTTSAQQKGSGGFTRSNIGGHQKDVPADASPTPSSPSHRLSVTGESHQKRVNAQTTPGHQDKDTALAIPTGKPSLQEVSVTGNEEHDKVSPTPCPSSLVPLEIVGGYAVQDNFTNQVSQTSSYSSHEFVVDVNADHDKENTEDAATPSPSINELPADGTNTQGACSTSPIEVPKEKQKIDLDAQAANLASSASPAEGHELKEQCELSAMINAGIIQFLQNKLLPWVDSMERQYAVKIKRENGENYMVAGTYEGVIAFENYLENKFQYDKSVL